MIVFLVAFKLQRPGSKGVLVFLSRRVFYVFISLIMVICQNRVEAFKIPYFVYFVPNAFWSFDTLRLHWSFPA